MHSWTRIGEKIHNKKWRNNVKTEKKNTNQSMAKMSQKCSGIKYIKQPQPNKPKKSANSHSGQASVYGSNNLTHSKWPFLVAESLSWKPQGSLKSTIYEQIKYSGKIQQLVKIIVLDHQTLHNSAKKSMTMWYQNFSRLNDGNVADSGCAIFWYPPTCHIMPRFFRSSLTSGCPVAESIVVKGYIFQRHLKLQIP